MASSTKLFTPLTLGGKRDPVQLQHRVVMAPLTRLRSGEEGVPPAFAATYYGQRATEGGLLISEGVCISTTSRGYFGTPGLFRDNQLDAWKSVTQAVHVKGGKIFAQLWHTGRVGHPLNQPNGELPVSASAVSMDDVKSSAVTREGRKAYVTPRALEIEEIAGIVEDYRRAAVNAIEVAGFDGVELHSANGYLLEQFLCDGVNKRTDKYGGSVDNRSRFLFEALDAILSSVDPSKVGVRLSPFSITFGCTDSDPATIYGHVVEKLNAYDLAYLHVVEPRGRHVANPQVPKIGATAHFHTIYNGVLLTASGYDHESAVEVIATGVSDAVAFGRAFLATPDLVKRLRLGKPFNEPDPSTFYLGGEEGYTDYPFLEDVVLVKSPPSEPSFLPSLPFSPSFIVASRRRRIVIRDLESSAVQRNYLDVHGQCCSHGPCNEREQQVSQELQRARDSVAAVQVEKDKEIAFLKCQLSVYASLPLQKSPAAPNAFAKRAFAGFPDAAAATAPPPNGVPASPVAVAPSTAQIAAATSKRASDKFRLLAASRPQLPGPSTTPAISFVSPVKLPTARTGDATSSGAEQEGGFAIGVAPPPTARQLLKARLKVRGKLAFNDL